MRVLFVHDSPRSCLPVAEVLRSRHVVRLATALPDIRDEMGLVAKLACVVCVPSAKLRAVDVHEEVVRLGVPAERILVMSVDELAQPDAGERITQAISSMGSTLPIAS